MRKIKLVKEKLSIQNIGHFRFWMGIVVGLLISITLSLFFNYSREFFRLFSANSADLIILKRSELLFYNYFYAITSTCLGLAICISIWMANHKHQYRKSRLYKQLSRSNCLLIFWFALMAIARLGSNFPFILYSLSGYDNHLDLYNEFFWLFILIPIVIFMQAWFNVRLVYKAGRWILISFLVTVFFPLLLSFADYRHQKINTFYHNLYEQDYSIIQQELQTARDKYEIEFDSTSIEFLKKWHSEYGMEQVKQVKIAFSKGKRVPMDTIILEKIIIQLAKRSTAERNHRKPMENWYYVEPKQLYKQLEYYEPNDPEVYELLEILKEQIVLANLSIKSWRQISNYSKLDKRRAYYGEYVVPNGILDQLKTISDSLNKQDKYKNLSSGLPEITKKENKYSN